MTLGSTTFGRQSNATSRLRRRLRLRWLLGSFVGIVLLCGLVYIGICSYMAVSLTRVERHPFTRSPETCGLAYESVNFPSRIDAISLDGWLLPASGNPARLPVIVVHGKGSDRQAEAGGHTLDIAAQLVRDGHPVLLFDLRGSGRSGGDRFTLGAQEVRDVGGAIDFLAARGLADNGVDALGFSMGASTALIVASRRPYTSHRGGQWLRHARLDP